MTITVELDIFSGMPNPSWQLSEQEERELVDRIMADHSLVAPITADTGGLGYRGFIIHTSERNSRSAFAAAGLPSTFRLGGKFDKAQAASLWTLATAQQHDAGVDGELYEVSEQAIEEAAAPEASPDNVQSADAEGVKQACTYRYLTSDVDFSFWNGASYITKNNCYNFASNYRSNTFAQPGRKTGSYCTSSTCRNATTMANLVRRDGYSDYCLAYPNYNIAICLVIWPGQDFHFYRLCANGHWCHKPGQTPAKNTDNSGRLITSVETCNRGYYTQIAGYFYANRSMVVL